MSNASSAWTVSKARLSFIKRSMNRALTVVLCATAGMALSTAVAWGAALWFPLVGQRQQPASAEATPWPEPVPESWPVRATTEFNRSSAVLSERIWIGFFRGRSCGVTRLRSGWPCYALRCQIWHWDGPELAVAGRLNLMPTPAWRAPQIVPRAGASEGWLSLAPIWRGFVVNTTFYGAAVWLTGVGVVAARRRFRLRRGLCPLCAYNLSGIASMCPECDGS